MSGKGVKKSNIAPANQLLSSANKRNTMENYVVKEGTEPGEIKNQSSRKIATKKLDNSKKIENTLASSKSHSEESPIEYMMDHGQKTVQGKDGSSPYSEMSGVDSNLSDDESTVGNIAESLEMENITGKRSSPSRHKVNKKAKADPKDIGSKSQIHNTRLALRNATKGNDIRMDISPGKQDGGSRGNTSSHSPKSFSLFSPQNIYSDISEEEEEEGGDQEDHTGIKSGSEKCTNSNSKEDHIQSRLGPSGSSLALGITLGLEGDGSSPCLLPKVIHGADEELLDSEQLKNLSLKDSQTQLQEKSILRKSPQTIYNIPGMDETEELRQCTAENTYYANSLSRTVILEGISKDKEKEVPSPELLVRTIKFDLIPQIQIVEEEEENEVEEEELRGRTDILGENIDQENSEDAEEPNMEAQSLEETPGEDVIEINSIEEQKSEVVDLTSPQISRPSKVPVDKFKVKKEKRQVVKSPSSQNKEKLNPYLMEPSAENILVSSATIRTKYLLVSRVPSYASKAAIDHNLASIGFLLKVKIDMEEFNSRYTTNRGVFLKNSKKSTLLVKLKDMADFHTLGTRVGPNLPLFFFTQIGPSRWETNWRLTVQAVSIEGMINVDTLFEVVAIRGLPDCCHTTSAILPIILNHLQANIEVEFLPVITTVPIVRRHGLGEKAEDLRVEELIIRVYIKNSTNTKRNEIRDQLQSCQIPAQFDLGSWVGQIADGHTWFEFSPTNTPALLHTSFVLFIEGLSGSPSDDLDYLQQYFSDKTEFASIGYIRGAIDSPTYANPADVLLLFPTSAGGGMIVFDDEGWERDHPADQLGSHVLLPGFISLHRNYRINPQVPEGVNFQPNEQKRPGGAFVQKLVRWNEVQEVLPVIRSGEMDSGRGITKSTTREKTVNRSRVEELATGESSRTITTSAKEPGRDLIPARNGEEVVSEPSEGTSALCLNLRKGLLHWWSENQIKRIALDQLIVALRSLRGL